MASRILKIGTRGSALALAQAEMVECALAAAYPELELERVIVKTVGDKRTDLRFSEFGAKGEAIVDKGIFTKELEEALAAGDIDIAVHSLKDVPTDLPEGFSIPCVLPRAAIEDVLISRHSGGIEQLPDQARIGTSSVRRIRQLLHFRPDLQPVEIRGNVPTRIRKLLDDQQNLDAILLARAGLERLGILGKNAALEYWILPPEQFLPAASQGAVGIEVHVRSGEEIPALLQAIHCPETGDQITAERAFLAALGAGCTTPIGLCSSLHEDSQQITLLARVFSDDPDTDGANCPAEGQATGLRSNPQQLASDLLSVLFP
jgi:hydroxymethylbilane synthase